MSYKKNLLIFIFLLNGNCTYDSLNNNKVNHVFGNKFVNKGFALVYNDKLYKEKIISKKLDQRSFTIFQKNLKKNTKVKITNILNKKILIATVGNDSLYPLFNNSVISTRIANELELDLNEPYIEIISITENSMFVSKRAKTYDEEKQVAEKVPINGITINNLNKTKNINQKMTSKNFSYKIKIADFYFYKTALLMVKRIKDETKNKNTKIEKISDKKYRVYLGPFDDINSLQNSYNDINILSFENIEIIKND